MRCLTLADMLKNEGCEIHFICRDPGHLACRLTSEHDIEIHGLTTDTHSLPSDADRGEYGSWLGVAQAQDAADTREILQMVGPFDWLIVDHYALDSRWEAMMRPLIPGIAVIDDLADRGHDCDLLLDQNLYDHLESRYDDLVPAGCYKLLGPQYALLREEFYTTRQFLLPRDGTIKQALIFFGGGDPMDMTGRAITAIASLPHLDFLADVIIGDANPHREAIYAACEHDPRLTPHNHVDNMAELMARADLALGGGGMTTWERCFLGLPAITVIIAENQRAMTEAAARAGAIWNMGWHEQVTVERLAQAIAWATENPLEVKAVGDRALHLMKSSSAHTMHPMCSAIMERKHQHVG